MQPNQLNLQVDKLNDATIIEQSFSRYEEYQNRSAYIGEDHTPGTRDVIALYRSFPTKVGNFKGVGKTSVKLTRDLTVPGVDETTSIAAPIIIEVSFSVPVGTTAESVVEQRQRLIALLDNDAFMNDLNLKLMI